MNAFDPDFSYLKKIWTLKTVAECGSLKRASIKNKVSVSAISQSVSGLEKTLGRKLMVKKDRHLVPTQYCLELLSSAESAFRVFEDLQKVSQGPVCVPPMAWLNFGVSQCVAADILPRLAKRLKGQLPELKLTLRVGRCAELISLVKKGDLCMALVVGDEEIRGVTTYSIYEDRLGVFVAATHPGRDDPEKLLSEGIASMSAGADGHPLYYTRFLRSLAEKPRVVMSCNQYETLYEMAATGVLPAILPQRLALRAPGVLSELSYGSPAALAAGKFSVRMISEKACDPSEDQFLISELRSLV